MFSREVAWNFAVEGASPIVLQEECSPGIGLIEEHNSTFVQSAKGTMQVGSVTTLVADFEAGRMSFTIEVHWVKHELL